MYSVLKAHRSFNMKNHYYNRCHVRLVLLCNQPSVSYVNIVLLFIPNVSRWQVSTLSMLHTYRYPKIVNTLKFLLFKNLIFREENFIHVFRLTCTITYFISIPYATVQTLFIVVQYQITGRWTTF